METLAPEPGLLLPAGRRPDARRRPLLRRQPHQPDRPGEARRRARPTPPRPTRTILAEARARARTIPVKTPTNIHALLEFASGATVTLVASWDVWAHRHAQHGALRHRRRALRPRPELVRRHGRDRRPRRQDRPRSRPGTTPSAVPNDIRAERHAAPTTAPPASPTWPLAILEGRDARCSLDRALHGVEVMTSILKSGETGALRRRSRTTCTRPDALSPGRRRRRCWLKMNGAIFPASLSDIPRGSSDGFAIVRETDAPGGVQSPPGRRPSRKR